MATLVWSSYTPRPSPDAPEAGCGHGLGVLVFDRRQEVEGAIRQQANWGREPDAGQSRGRRPRPGGEGKSEAVSMSTTQDSISTQRKKTNVFLPS
jgi:hypothetical protein